MNNADKLRERRIETYYRALLHAQSPITKRLAAQRMAVEIRQRSPARVRKMEVERGLARG